MGVHFSEGELIARMDSDDISDPYRLQEQVSYFLENPSVSVLGSSYYLIDSNNNILKVVHPPSGNSAIRRFFYFTNPICHPSVMMRRHCLTDLGGYSYSLHAEDYDLWVRLSLSSKCIFHNLSKPLLSYRSVSIGEARSSRNAYVSMLTTQVNALLCSKNPTWLISILITYVKIIFSQL